MGHGNVHGFSVAKSWAGWSTTPLRLVCVGRPPGSWSPDFGAFSGLGPPRSRLRPKAWWPASSLALAEPAQATKGWPFILAARKKLQAPPRRVYWTRYRGHPIIQFGIASRRAVRFSAGFWWGQPRNGCSWPVHRRCLRSVSTASVVGMVRGTHSSEFRCLSSTFLCLSSTFHFLSERNFSYTR